MPESDAEALMANLKAEAEQTGYLLNPDEELVLMLMNGLLINSKRYGYMACPCMESSGKRDEDLDIICPCDYRDADLDEFGSCYCGLYVSEPIFRGEQKVQSIPLRRPETREGPAPARTGTSTLNGVEHKIWRCPVCGYLCAREKPPLKCPICKADQDRFIPFA